MERSESGMLSLRHMFGVNKEGQDILAPQFRKGGASGMQRSEPLLHRDPEHEMAVLSEKVSITKSAKIMNDLRQRATELLSRNNTRHPQESEVQKFMELEVDRLADERVKQHKKEMAEMASRAAVLRLR